MNETKNRSAVGPVKLGLAVLFAACLAALFALCLVVSRVAKIREAGRQMERPGPGSIGRVNRAIAGFHAVPTPPNHSGGTIEAGDNLSNGGNDAAWQRTAEKDPWPTFYADCRRTGRGIGHGARGVPKWQFETEDSVTSSPAVGAGGVVFVAGGDDNLYALSARSGKQLWRFSRGAEFDTSVVLGGRGRLYVGDSGGRLYALARANGRVLWKFSVRGHMPAELALGQDNTVFATSNQGDLYAVNGATGLLEWTRRLGHEPQAAEFSPALGSGHRLYIASSGSKGSDRQRSGQVTALDSRSGDEIWSFQTDTDLTAPVSVGDDGTVYCAGWNGAVFALDGLTGKPSWIKHVSEPISTAPGIGLAGEIYIGGFDKFYALRKADGQVEWEFNTGPDTMITAGLAIDSSGDVYFGTEDVQDEEENDKNGRQHKQDGQEPEGRGKLFALDGRTGKQKWAYPMDWGANGAPSIGADGTIYIGGLDGSLHAINEMFLPNGSAPAI